MKRAMGFGCGWSLSILLWAGGIREGEEALRQELSLWCEKLGVPGATAAFVMEDGGFGEVAVGLSDQDTGRSMMPGDRMPAASIGKSMVGACAITMEAEGLLDLDDPIARWLGHEPWFPRLPGNGTITARQLLHHTSGLPDHIHLPAFQEAVAQQWAEEENRFTSKVLVEYILDQPALFPPGESWNYSDTGYVVLGMVIERATGRPVSEWVEERFLIPLQLTHTTFANQRRLPGLVPGITVKENPFGFPVKSTDAEGNLRWHPALENYGGGWISTSGDLARWGDALFAGAALPRDARSRLRQTVPTSAEPNALRYGPGVGFIPKGFLGPAWGHGGWIPGYISSVRHYSWQGLTVAFQINSDVIQDSESENWMKEMELRLAEVIIQTWDTMEAAQHD